MSDNKNSDEFSSIAMILGLIIIVPIFVASMLGQLLQALSPAMPFLLFAVVAGGIAFAVYKYQTSPLTIRRQHEKEVLELWARAEGQQRSLPRQLAENDLAVALDQRGVKSGTVPVVTFLGPAQAIYAEEFLRALPPMPGVPLEAERVYDIDYDRRTLRKGEKPPHRVRTDSRGRPTSLELQEFEAWLHRFVASTVNPDATYAHFISAYADFAAAVLSGLPTVEDRAGGGLTVPLIDLLPHAKSVIGTAVAVFWQPSVREWHHFFSVREAFNRNRQNVSGQLLRERDLAAGNVLDPASHPGTPRETLDAYLASSPLRALFLAEMPFTLPLAKRFEGHWIVARQGSGKTNALECLIQNDLAEVAAGRASLLVMDSQGISPDTLIGRLATLKTFSPGGALEAKLIYLEPDLEFPLALNVFDIGMAQMGQLTEAQREDIVGSACDVVEFLFTGLLGGELSDNMTMLYRYLVPAMLAIPDADMTTFIELLDTESGRDRSVPAGFQKHRRHLSGVDPEIRSFLEADYLHDIELVKTKAAVRRRLRAALADTMFRRMFMQPRNKLNLFRELQSAKVILVNTYPAKSYVEPFGRLILALLMQATRQRLEIDRDQRMPTFVYLDECQDYIAREDRIAKYIDKCRKQNVGLVFAHQRLSNIESQRVLNALSGVSIKFSGVSEADASELAGFVGSTAEHIRNLPRGHFAAHVSGLTPQAVDLSFPPSPLEHAPRLNKTEFDALRAEMRERYGMRYRPRSEVSDLAVPPATRVAQPNGKDVDGSNRRLHRGAEGRAPVLPSANDADAERQPDQGSSRPESEDYDPLQ